jgi:hypothetical protein
VSGASAAFVWRTRAGALLASLLAFACGGAEGAPPPTGIAAEVSEAIATVVTVRWTTKADSIGYVEYGPTPALGSKTPLEMAPTRQHRATLLGLRADAPYHYRVVTWDGSQAAASDVLRVKTGPLPPSLPELSVAGEGLPGFVVVPLRGTSEAVVIVDGAGHIVWYHEDESGLVVHRARASRERTVMIYGAAAADGSSDDSALVRVALDGSGATSLPLPHMVPDFVERSDGTLAALVVDERDIDGEPVRGNALVELDPEGNPTTLVSLWDCLEPTEAPSGRAEGWTLANALDLERSEKGYLVGLSGPSAILRVDRAAGCDWLLGSAAATVAFGEGSAEFRHQSQFDLYQGHLYVMDGDGSSRARLIDYRLDLDAATATEAGQITADLPGPLALGDPKWIQDTGFLVNWASAGRMELLDADGNVLWQLDAPSGTTFGYATFMESPYTWSQKEQ